MLLSLWFTIVWCKKPNVTLLLSWVLRDPNWLCLDHYPSKNSAAGWVDFFHHQIWTFAHFAPQTLQHLKINNLSRPTFLKSHCIRSTCPLFFSALPFMDCLPSFCHPFFFTNLFSLSFSLCLAEHVICFIKVCFYPFVPLSTSEAAVEVYTRFLGVKIQIMSKSLECEWVMLL